MLAALVAFAVVQTPVKKVLVIGIDGCRPDALLKAEAPNIDALIADGCWAVGKADPLTVSGPCWSSILCGVRANKHGVRDNAFAGANYKEYPDFISVAERIKPDLRTYSVASWAPINEQIVQKADYEGPKRGKGDDVVAVEAADLLIDQDPDVVFVHFDDVDHAGHTYGYGPEIPEYMRSIVAVDKNVGLVLQGMRARKTFANEDWLVIVVSDHGGTGKSHGQAIPEHINIPFIVSGRSAADAFSVIPTQWDVAPTVFRHLGIGVPRDIDWDGVPVGLKGVDSLTLEKERDENTVKIDMPSGVYLERVIVHFSVENPRAVIRTTFDGSLPKWEGQGYRTATFTRDITVRARAFRDGVPLGPSTFAAYVIQEKALDPSSIEGALPGLTYSVVEGEFASLRDVDFSAATRKGVAGRPSARVGGSAVSFAVRFDGFVYVPSEGTWSFALNSDDGSRLWVSGKLVVDNDGVHSVLLKKGSVGLKAGWHEVRLEYFQAGGEMALGMAMGKSGEELVEVGSDALRHSPGR